MLLETAIADAALAPFEFKDEAKRATFTQDRYHTPDGVGRYTDDTQMSLAVCEHLLAGRPNTQAAWARTFMRAYQRDVRPGYSKRVSGVLSMATPEDMLAAVGAAGDRRGNGTVMRAAPLGYLADPGEVVALCTVQSTATHASQQAATAACCVALAAHYLRHRWRPGTPMDLAAFVRGALPEADGVLRAWRRGPVPCDAAQTASYAVAAASHALEAGRPPEWLLDEAARLGGDADSTAAVSVALLSIGAPGDPCPDCPDGPLLAGLEGGEFGRPRLEATDAAMEATFPRNPAK